MATVTTQPNNPQGTDFTAMSLQERYAWAKSIWSVFRVRSFAARFMGADENSVIQRITELTQVNGVSKAVIQLVADLQSDGVAGDNELEGKEEKLRAFEQQITYDQLRHAVRSKGKLSDAKATISVRNHAKDKLGQFFADRTDQMAFLALSGIAFTKMNNGKTRDVTSNLLILDFAGSVTAPTTNRYLRCVAGGGIGVGNTASLTANDKINYKSLVRAKAYAKETGMRGIRDGADEVYHVFVTPQGMADLRLDPDFMENVRAAGTRGDANPLFAGATSVLVDGMYVHEYHYVFNTLRASAGSKWGASGTVDGMACLILGAQALGFADLGVPTWTEKPFDYDNQTGVATAKILGMLKPKFQNDITGTVEDYGVLRLDCALSPLTVA